MAPCSDVASNRGHHSPTLFVPTQRLSDQRSIATLELVHIPTFSPRPTTGAPPPEQTAAKNQPKPEKAAAAVEARCSGCFPGNTRSSEKVDDIGGSKSAPLGRSPIGRAAPTWRGWRCCFGAACGRELRIGLTGLFDGSRWRGARVPEPWLRKRSAGFRACGAKYWSAEFRSPLSFSGYRGYRPAGKRIRRSLHFRTTCLVIGVVRPLGCAANARRPDK